MLLHDRLVEAVRLLVLGLLHVEHVAHIQFPGIVVVAEFHRFPDMYS